MRFLILLFNLYLLVLPCLPCGDVDECVKENKKSNLLQKEHNPKDGHTEDTCTPFCHCSCCTSLVTFLAHTTEKHKIKFLIKKNYNLESTQYATNSGSAIWQPPKQTIA
jgi:hypothetical protein